MVPSARANPFALPVNRVIVRARASRRRLRLSAPLSTVILRASCAPKSCTQPPEARAAPRLGGQARRLAGLETATEARGEIPGVPLQRPRLEVSRHQRGGTVEGVTALA